MKSSRLRRRSPLRYAAVGASVLAAPFSAAVAASSAHAAASASIHARAEHGTIAYGHRMLVVGRAPSSEAGQTVALQFTPIGSGDWRQVATGSVHRDGSFRLVAWLSRSGWLRVAPAPIASGAMTAPASAASVDASPPRRVAVAAAVRLRPRSIGVFGARTIRLQGRLLPAAAWRRVLLQGDQGGRWRTLATGRTSRLGWFKVRYRASSLGSEPLRVSFAGDRRNAPVSTGVGTVTGYQQAIASWYYDGGSTACGFHAYYGVANLSLPCGTRVNFAYNGHRVQAVVDDRGPYVGGRTWDLNQNTAAALGFGGVGTVWSSR